MLQAQAKIIIFLNSRPSRTRSKREPTSDLKILAQLHETVYWRRHELWSNAWIWHPDSASVHDALIVRHLSAKQSIIKMGHR